MYIVSENENLLERLGLLVLNSEVLNTTEQEDEEANGDQAEFIATLATGRHYCEPTSNFLVLVAKNWDQLMLDTIADLVRLLMAFRPEGDGKIVVIKKDVDPGDHNVLQAHLLDVRQRWMQEWTFQFEKVRNMPSSEARSEALKRLDAWTAPKLPRFSLLHFEDPDLPTSIAKEFELRNGLRIREGFPNRPTLFSKPPALHWSHFPRESELQIMFKFTFPQGTVPDPVFRDFANAAKAAYDWEYDYEWRTGVFLRHELTKISVYRTNIHTVEVAGRIDTDEYAAEIEDDSQADNPFKVVWPLLARVLKTIIRDCIEYKTDGHLPYMLNIAFFGTPLFQDINYVDLNGPVSARLLDATQTFAAIERTGSIKFAVGRRLMGIDIKLAFPGFQPHSLADLYALSDLPVASSRNSTSSSRLSPAPPGSLTATVILEQRDEEDAQTLPHNDINASPPHSAGATQYLGFSERSNSQTGLLGMNMAAAAKNRGRRVSFGAIHAIPQNVGERREFHFADLPSKSTNLKKLRDEEGSNGGGSLRNLSGEAHRSPIAPSPSPSQSSVNEYVDKMLKQTIDEVLVMD